MKSYPSSPDIEISLTSTSGRDVSNNDKASRTEDGLPTLGLTLRSADKEVLGATAVNIRSLRPPEPYKGKGIKYSEERIRRKEGKTGTT